MHRSGTSLLTNLLQKLGVFIGNDLDDNYESQFFCKLNDWAMFQTGATWDSPLNMNFLTPEIEQEIADNFQKHINSKYIKKYCNNFQNLLSENKHWGWKDPRNTFTLSIWKKIYNNPKIIHIYRNPIDVAQSLKKREQIFQQNKGTQTKTGVKRKINEKMLINKRLYSQSVRVNLLSEGVKLWKEYTSAALNFTQNTIHIQYENMLENSTEILTQISNFIGLNVTENTISDVTANIDKSRKFAFTDDKTLSSFYQTIKKNELLQKLNYHKII